MRRKFILAQLFLLILLTDATRPWFSWTEGDLTLYGAVCRRLGRGQWPYIHFPLEYPPLAALLFATPRLVGVGWSRFLPQSHYPGVFMVMAALVAAAGSPAVASMAEAVGLRVSTALWRYTLLLLLMFPMVTGRYDAFPMLMTALAVMCLLQRRHGWAGAWLGAAIAAKLYPAVLLGLFVGYPLAQRRWGDAGRLLVMACVTALLPLTPYLAIHSTAFLSVLSYHHARGLQVESVPGAALLLAGAAHWLRVGVVHGFGSDQVSSAWSEMLLRWQPIVAAAVLAALTLTAYLRMRRDVQATGSPSPASTVEAAAALLLAFIVSNKVFSTQYLLWIAPLAPLLSRRLWYCIVAAAALTTLVYLGFYFQLLVDRPLPVLLLNVRNLAAMAVLVGLVLRVARRERGFGAA
jgi:hypothetical protein